ncbi:hypothetical protein HYALB_00009502 [Hymenoscyphus albidus]|uniref:Uncharacterized protein n=1 Tax=Hymenoscyphus albidus TaxID=595503 RepID=A0A9N9LJ83_9HELO|nr:hypothetical protein HYALB_00009502 [Hymenoscyphus albidus]
MNSTSTSTHPEKKPRPLQHRVPAKSPIATPPRAALGRSREHADNASIKSCATGDGLSIHTQNGSALEEMEDSAPSTISEKQEKDREKDKAIKTEKRDRIASLERELETMANGFEKELTLLSHKLTNERESSTFWQQKHTSLHQTYIETDTALRLLRSEGSALKERENQSRERDSEIKMRVEGLVVDRDAFREAYEDAMEEVGEKEELVSMLRNQVRGLKSWVSKGGRGGEEQVSDESVGEGWGRLSNGLQNWVIVNFRRVKVGNVDINKPNLAEKEELLRLLPNYETLASTSKIHFIQSLVSRLLVDNIFTSYFVGIPPDRAEELKKMESFLRDYGPEESINQWRSTTLSLLRKSAPALLAPQTNALIATITTKLNDLLSSVSDSQPSESRDSSLRTLLISAIELSRLLRSQKAVFSVNMPVLEEHQRTMFESGEMEDVGGEDEEELILREIRCVVFPGVVKWGDECGEKGWLRNVVVKVKVLCLMD